jgi:hypothetical protein
MWRKIRSDNSINFRRWLLFSEDVLHPGLSTKAGQVVCRVDRVLFSNKNRSTAMHTQYGYTINCE